MGCRCIHRKTSKALNFIYVVLFTTLLFSIMHLIFSIHLIQSTNSQLWKIKYFRFYLYIENFLSRTCHRHFWKSCSVNILEFAEKLLIWSSKFYEEFKPLFQNLTKTNFVTDVLLGIFLKFSEKLFFRALWNKSKAIIHLNLKLYTTVFFDISCIRRSQLSKLFCVPDRS